MSTLNDLIVAAESKPMTFVKIAEERLAQQKKWGTQNHLATYWAGILGEEFGEVCRCIIEGDFAAARNELIQVAAVAVAFYESLDRNELRTKQPGPAPRKR